MPKRHVLSLIAALFLSAPQLPAADSGNFYKPNYRYSGPQSQTIGDEMAEGKDPLLATVFAVLPGIVFHGFGNFYAGDYDNGTRCLVAEIVGVGVAFWGHNIIHETSNWGPYFGDSASQAGYWIKGVGVTMIAASWIYDIASAADAAQSFNKDHQIQFQLEGRYDGLQLALAHKF